MIQLDSVYENIGDEEILINRVFDVNGNKLGQIRYKRTGNKSKPWQPQTFEMKPDVALNSNELKDVIAELEGKEQTPEPKNDMTFLCLGVIKHQHEFFRREVQHVFGERIDKMVLLYPWGGMPIFVCMAEPGIHSEIKMFVTGFTSGFKSAL